MKSKLIALTSVMLIFTAIVGFSSLFNSQQDSTIREESEHKSHDSPIIEPSDDDYYSEYSIDSCPKTPIVCG